MSARWIGVALAAVLGACTERGEDLRPAPAPTTSGFEPIASALPERIYYLERRAGRCSVYSIFGGERSPGTDVGCPRELLDGERMVLRAQVCVRESTDPSRAVPVRCAKHLTWAARGQPGR
jgi:hypothetical protein